MMQWRQWTRALYDLLRPAQQQGEITYSGARRRVTHVIILDGTMSSLSEGREGNAGLTYKLLSENSGANVSIYYEAGLQLYDWRSAPGVLLGRGINHQIRRAYGHLASRYRYGDRIFLIGYSRGAYAVRSLAGMIDCVGLLQARHATERNVRTAYRHYQFTPDDPVTKAFTRAFCHEDAPVEMVGVWDTVKALGMRLPVLWRWSEKAYSFHSHVLGHTIRNGYQALALDETRVAYKPVLWQTRPEFKGRMEQVWFRGCHGDVGGQLDGFDEARPLANIPLVWMLERMETCGLELPDGWRGRFACDVKAPSVGNWRGWGKIFLLRGPRVVGQDPSERLHETVAGRDPSMTQAHQAV